MLNNINTLTTLLITIICVVFVLIVVLAVIYFASNAKKQKKDTAIKEEKTNEPKGATSKTFAVESVMDFMEFDKIEDNRW